MLNQPRKFIFTLVDQPKYGTAYIDGNTLIFTPEENFTGDVSFRYYAQVIRNGKPSINSKFEKITITVVNNPPRARSGSQSVKENGRKVFNLSASDADGDELTYRIITQPTKGSLLLTGLVEQLIFHSIKMKVLIAFRLLSMTA